MYNPCPINTVEILGIGAVNLKGLIVVVGPNSAGKTQLLNDINEVVCGRVRKFVVVSGINLAVPPSSEEYLDILLKNGALRESPKPASAPIYQKIHHHQYGSDTQLGDPEIADETFKHYCKQLKDLSGRVFKDKFPGSPFLVNFGGLSCSALFLANRLTLTGTRNNFNYRIESATNTLQSLHRNREAKALLTKEISEVFQRGIWLDATQKDQLCFLVAESNEIPSVEDRIEPEKMEIYRKIDSEGDGMRSYTAISITLLLKDCSLCLIDEPEMCLHPPQAFAIGRFIGKHAASETCTIVATHSSHVLRGILETRPDVQVIRLEHYSSKFTAKLVDPKVLQVATQKPRSRSEAILDGLLSHAVALCEAETDRIVYEATYRSLEDHPIDIRFVSVGGTGGFVEPLKLYNLLGVPTAIIADIDFMRKNSEIKDILLEQGLDHVAVSAECAAIIERIRASGPHLSCAEAITRLKELAERSWDWSQGQDEELVRALRSLDAELSRFNEFKRKGVNGVPSGDVQEKLKKLLDLMAKQGLFLVPVGELESWVPNLMTDVSRYKKPQWASIAATRIEEAEAKSNDVWGFVRAISEHLLSRLSAK